MPPNPSHSFITTFDDHPFHQMLGLTLVESSANFGKILLTKSAATPQGIGGSVHGGVLASMVDISMLVAMFAQMREGEEPAGTADLNISYLRQALGERIYATAKVVKRGRMLSNIEVDITDAEDRLCARGRVLYAFRPH